MNTQIYISGIEKEQSLAELKSIKRRFSRYGLSLVVPPEMAFAKMKWSDNVQNRLAELKKCDVVYMLPNWRNDVMTRIELTAAMDMKKHILFHPISCTEIKQLIAALDV